MTRPVTDTSLYAECLAAMAASGESFPCEFFAPIWRADDSPPVVAGADLGGLCPTFKKDLEHVRQSVRGYV